MSRRFFVSANAEYLLFVFENMAGNMQKNVVQ